ASAQRFRHSQGIANAKENAHLRDNLVPQGQRQAVAWVFPTPRFAAREPPHQLSRLIMESMKARFVLPTDGVQPRRTIPFASQFLQNGVVELQKGTVLPKALGIIGGGRQQFLLRPKIETANMKDIGDHRSS